MLPLTPGQPPDDMLSSEVGSFPLDDGDIPSNRRGDKHGLVMALRQCAIIILCACDDYLGRQRTLQTKRRRT